MVISLCFNDRFACTQPRSSLYKTSGPLYLGISKIHILIHTVYLQMLPSGSVLGYFRFGTDRGFEAAGFRQQAELHGTSGYRGAREL